MLMLDIADQIERERACDEDAIENVRLIVGRVIDDMERHVSGVEGADDSPVARWARELRRALKSDTSDGCDSQNPSCTDAAEAADVTSDTQKVTRDPADDVSMSAYDLLPEEEREAIAWVREHGGLDYVKSEWRSRVPHDRYDRRRQRLLGHIAECETALGRRNQRISELEERVRVRERANDELNEELNAMRPRLMPEGWEWLLEVWPKWSNGEYCKFGDWWTADKYGDYEPKQLRRLAFFTPEQLREWEQDEGDNFGYEWDFMRPSDTTYRPDKVEPPAPKVLDADGAEIRVGDEVWDVDGSGPFIVSGFVGEPLAVIFEIAECNDLPRKPSQLTHRAPVLAADGEPLREGETAWLITSGREIRVDKIEHRPEGFWALELFADGSKRHSAPVSILTHERPESWERLEDDAEKDPCGYFGFDGEEICGKCPASGKNCEQTMALDLVRRARALAERERGE